MAATSEFSNQKAQTKDVGKPITVEELNQFKALGKSAFIVGYTGETGKELTRILHQSGVFKRIVLVGRRKVDYSQDALLKDAEQVQVDFDKVLEQEDLFRNIDVGFSCLGSSSVKHGIAEYIKVEHDYVVNTARAAKNAGVKHYFIVSTVSANEKSWSAMVKTKGRAEKGVIQVGFERLTIMRPAALLCDRSESRPHETAMYWFLKPVFKIAPTRFSVPTHTLGVAMFYRAVAPADEAVDIVENSRIHHLAANVPSLHSTK